MGTLVHSSQSAPVQEYRVLWTAQKKQKLKRWHDGFLRLHTFNNRMLLYDEGKNLVSDKYNKPGEPLHEGDELEFEQHLVTIEEFIRTVVQDLTPVFSPAVQRRHQRNAASVHNTPIRMPTGTGAIATPIWAPAHAHTPHGTRNVNLSSVSTHRSPPYGQLAPTQHGYRTPNAVATPAPPRILGSRTTTPANPMSRVNGATGLGTIGLQQAQTIRPSAHIPQDEVRHRPTGPLQQPAQPPRVGAPPQRAPAVPVQPVVRPSNPASMPPPPQPSPYTPATQETPTPAQRPALNYRTSAPLPPRFERAQESRPPTVNRALPNVKAEPPRISEPRPQPILVQIPSPPKVSPRSLPHPARRSKIPPSPKRPPSPPPPEPESVVIDDLIDLIDGLDDEVLDPSQELPKPASRKPKFRPPTRKPAPNTPVEPLVRSGAVNAGRKTTMAGLMPPPDLPEREPAALLKLPTATKRPRNKLLSRSKPSVTVAEPPLKRLKPDKPRDTTVERIEDTPPPEEPVVGRPWNSQMADEDLDIDNIEEIQVVKEAEAVKDWPGKEEGYDRTGAWTLETAFLFDFKRPKKQ